MFIILLNPRKLATDCEPKSIFLIVEFAEEAVGLAPDPNVSTGSDKAGGLGSKYASGVNFISVTSILPLDP